MGQFLDAAETILKRHPGGKTAKQITIEAQEAGLLEFSNGHTPFQTIKAKICVDIRQKGQESRFMRIGKGIFALREFGGDEYEARPFQQFIKPTEKVLVFSACLLDRLGYFHGINKNFSKYAKGLLDRKATRFIPRLEAENNADYKQVVSYVIVKKGDMVLRFVRGKYVSAQAFLKGRFCIGFGGHAQLSDFDALPLFNFSDSGYRESVKRELEEELKLPLNAITDDSLKMLGVLNDDSSFAGKVHFAFIHLLSLDHLDKIFVSQIVKNEKAINQLRFVPIKKLAENFDRYEYWSKLCIKTFFESQIKNIAASIKPIRNFELKRHSQFVAIVGNIGSGKTQACHLLEKKHGFLNIKTGEIVRAILNYSSKNRLKFQTKAYDFIRTKTGPQRLAASIIEIIQNNPGKRFVIDGIRNVETFELLKKSLKKLTLIYVHSTVEHCFNFSSKRDKSKRSMKDFFELIQHPVEKEIEQFIPLANIVFYNYGSKDSYLRAIQRYFSREL